MGGLRISIKDHIFDKNFRISNNIYLNKLVVTLSNDLTKI